MIVLESMVAAQRRVVNDSSDICGGSAEQGKTVQESVVAEQSSE